jgi:hypothetical protein
MVMRGKRSLVVAALVLLVLLSTPYWPTRAQTGGAAQPAGPLEKIEMRLEKMERALAQIQEQLKTLQQPKGTWQKINEPKDGQAYIIYMDMNTGKVRWVSQTTPGTVYEK